MCSSNRHFVSCSNEDEDDSRLELVGDELEDDIGDKSQLETKRFAFRLNWSELKIGLTKVSRDVLLRAASFLTLDDSFRGVEVVQV